MNNKRVFAFVTALCFTLVGSVGALWVGLFASIGKVSADSGNEHVYFDGVTNGQTLFETDGTINQTLSDQLRGLAYNVEKFDTFMGARSQYVASDAKNIRDINGGSLPTVKLFANAGTGTTATFTSRAWRLTYISYTQTGVPVFTFYMTEPYRSSAFNSTANMYTYHSEIVTNGGMTGKASLLHQNVVSDFNTVLGKFDNSIRDHILSPIQIPGQWQHNQNAAGWASHQSFRPTTENDLIWIPSSNEVGIEDVHIWNISNSERAYTIQDFGKRCWVRGSHLNAIASAPFFDYLGNTFNADTVTNSNAVRPAIHITLDEYTATANTWRDYQSALDALTQSNENLGNLVNTLKDRLEHLESRTDHTATITNILSDIANITTQIGTLTETIDNLELTCTHDPAPHETCPCLETNQAYQDALDARDVLIAELTITNQQLTEALTSAGQQPSDPAPGLDPLIIGLIICCGILLIGIPITYFLGRKSRKV